MMRRLASSRIRPPIAMVLAACLSLCCCSVQHLIGDVPARMAGAAAAESSCCDRCATADPEDGSPAPAPAGEGCCACCLKGTWPKELAPQLPMDAIAFAAITAPHLRLTVPATAGIVRPHPARSPVAPPTLLRLRCALIV